jgi:predicted metal-dependent peptidase
LYVLDVDTRVAKVHEVYPGEKIPASAHGGGGTDYRPAFEWIEKMGIQPAAVIYMGDMAAVFPEREPDYEVIWLKTTHQDPAVKWGHRVNLPL